MTMACLIASFFFTFVLCFISFSRDSLYVFLLSLCQTYSPPLFVFSFFFPRLLLVLKYEKPMLQHADDFEMRGVLAFVFWFFFLDFLRRGLQRHTVEERAERERERKNLNASERIHGRSSKEHLLVFSIIDTKSSFFLEFLLLLTC